VVRGPASVLSHAARGEVALLTVPLAALAYFEIASVLPDLGGVQAQTIVAGSLGLALIGACSLAAVEVRRSMPGLIGLAVGAGMIAAALAAGGEGAAADPYRAVMAGALGSLFASWFLDRRALVALPLVVAGIDAWSVSGGPASTLMGAHAIDFLTFDLPLWGFDAGRAGQLGLADAVFVGMFATWAWKFGLRGRVTGFALVLALLAGLVLGELLDEAIPVLPLLAAALLVPNADRILHLFSG